MSDLGIGLVGTGFMGRSHALALAAADRIFDLPRRPRLEILADASANVAADYARRLGFARATGDWRELVEDPKVDAVHIATPNALHLPIALAAIDAGKAVHCEKPLALNAADAERLAVAADEAGAVTITGFNYLKNPVQTLAREIIEAGEIGRPIGFRGIHAEDYMRDPDAPFTWRHERDGGGATMDVGSHIVSLARFLLGGIVRVTARSETIVGERTDASGRRRSVQVDDQCDALVEFESGVTGNLAASWVASGRSMQLAYEVVGTEGSIAFTQERLNELRLAKAGDDPRTAGFRTICAGPAHPPYGDFCPAPGHQLGFNDMKTIEMRDFLVAVTEGSRAYPDFRDAARTQAVVDAILASARDRRWVEVA